MMIDSELQYAIVERTALGDVLRDQPDFNKSRIFSLSHTFNLSEKEAIVLWSNLSPRPCAIIINDDQQDEFLSWINTFHNDLAPLTSWCHLLLLTEFKSFCARPSSVPNLGGSEAAWIGAIIAEAMALSGREYDTVSLASCLATQAFTAARLASLYGVEAAYSYFKEPPSSVLFRSLSNGISIILQKQVEVLLNIESGKQPFRHEVDREIFSACKKLHQLGPNSNEKAVNDAIHNVALSFTNYIELSSLSRLSAEDYVRLLRTIKDRLINADDEEASALKFVSGLLISRVGGAERDLRLAQQFGDSKDEVLCWAAVIGGLGVTAYWTNGFAGMGRLVARELTRPFRITDAPNCDVSYAEITCLQKLSDQNGINIRAANRNAISMSIRPGVTINVAAHVREEKLSTSDDSRRKAVLNSLKHVLSDDEIQELAVRLFPFLRPMIVEDLNAPVSRKSVKKNQTSLKFR